MDTHICFTGRQRNATGWMAAMVRSSPHTSHTTQPSMCMTRISVGCFPSGMSFNIMYFVLLGSKRLESSVLLVPFKVIDKSLALYYESLRFKSECGNHLSWLKFCVFFSVLPKQMHNWNLKTLYSHFLAYLLFIIHIPVIQCFIFLQLMKNQTENIFILPSIRSGWPNVYTPKMMFISLQMPSQTYSSTNLTFFKRNIACFFSTFLLFRLKRIIL
jgi:hypothetical protein